MYEYFASAGFCQPPNSILESASSATSVHLNNHPSLPRLLSKRPLSLLCLFDPWASPAVSPLPALTTCLSPSIGRVSLWRSPLCLLLLQESHLGARKLPLPYWTSIPWKGTTLLCDLGHFSLTSPSVCLERPQIEILVTTTLTLSALSWFLSALSGTSSP